MVVRQNRKDKRPILTDLRGSGQIEQDADIVIFMYYHYKYNPDNKILKNTLEANILKFKKGDIGMNEVEYHPDQYRII